MKGISEKLEWITLSLNYFWPEIILSIGILLLIIAGLLLRNRKSKSIFEYVSLICFALSLLHSIYSFEEVERSIHLFNNMLTLHRFSIYLKILFDVAGILTVLLSFNHTLERKSEYYALIITIVLGAHLLVMSTNFVMLFISIELISLPSYLLAAFAFNKRSMEAALKYFLFGSAASAVMLYGITLLYSLTQTLDYGSEEFALALIPQQNPFLIVSVCMVFAGLLFKITSAPFHIWAPDVYEAAPTPVVAFFSVVPKLAGIGALATFYLAMNLHGQVYIRWYYILGFVALITLTIGNFAALLQKSPKRMMAYSSIAQAGFLLIGIVTGSNQGVQFVLFYGTTFLLANYLVFYYIDRFEQEGVLKIEDYAGLGSGKVVASLFMLVGLVSLIGLPPTAGFTAKLLLFSSLWIGLQTNAGVIYLLLFVFGLLYTVVALFYYLKIPYQAFLKQSVPGFSIKKSSEANLLGIILVILLLALFFYPSGLMGWLNRINFAP